MNIQRISVLVVTQTWLICAATAAQSQGATSIQDVAGLRARLEIVRDREGVPHIRAASEADAIFGLGYVHAQDRLWQLEYLRRLGTGRLAEVLGPAGVDPDKLFRTLGVAQSAAATWAKYGPKQRQLIVSYVAGLNAATDRQRNQRLPPEFEILNFRPEQWRAEDVLVIAKVLGWTVDTNWSQELLRIQLTQKVGAVRAAQLMPAYTTDGPLILPRQDASTFQIDARGRQTATPISEHAVMSELLALNRRVVERTGLGGVGLGSNNQVLGASRTTTGGAILASDPHLPAQIPSIFYRVHITGGALDAIGATAPGLPGVLMGHNGHVAWGWTNANADVQDLFVEKIFDGREAEYEGAREPLQFRTEVIKVKGAPDVVLSVRSTRHGPLVSDLVDPNGPALALRWAALDSDDDIGVAAYLEANRAHNWQQFTDAFRKFKAHPQNLVYADTRGNIAYLLAGAIPVRRAGDGKSPAPGWTSEYEWNGYIPFARLPQSLNPTRDYLASSNNKIAPDTYPYTLSNSYAAPYRATRALELLRARNRHSLRDLEDMQADVFASHARELLALLPKKADGATEMQALDLLKGWDHQTTSTSSAAAVFEAWYIQLAESLFADELGESLFLSYSDQLHMVSMAMASAIRENSEWCDDVRTPRRETCESIALSALELALARMSAVQGTRDVSAWQWGKAHRAVFFHRPFDADPVLGPRFNRMVTNGGDKHTLNVASNPRWRDYDQRHVALYRQIIDLSNLSNSRWMAAPGESGLPADRHYDDSIEEWQKVRYRPMLFSVKAVDEAATDRLVLTP